MKVARLFTLVLFFFALQLSSQSNSANQWVVPNESMIPKTGVRQIIPQKYRLVELNNQNFKAILFSAPSDKRTKIEQSNCIISLPLPDGSFQAYKVIESYVMCEALAAGFPNIKTFSVKGIDDPFAYGKLDWNEFGFHAMIASPQGDYFIDPYSTENTRDYISYYTAGFIKTAEDRVPENAAFETIQTQHKGAILSKKNAQAATICVGAQLRTYRLAVACTGEYAVAATASATPTKAQTLSKIVTTINRVDGVYQKELAIHLLLVATETNVIFANAVTDPFGAGVDANGVALLNRSQPVIDSLIGNNNYDVGHTFSTGGGGIANVGCVCIAGDKAHGITGSKSPVGDPYDIDYVAHEMGHQFGGNHTFNANTDNCGGGNRYAPIAVEPGSGVTIMAYAGICGINNLANNSIPYFHTMSYDEIVYFTQSGAGNNCPLVAASGNQAPVVNGAGNYIIPKSTPFALTGSAVDPDGDPLVYSWEEVDAGNGAGDNWNSGQRPYFRSYAPVATATRLFPNAQVANSGTFTTTMGEYLPTSAQTLNFRLTARDNKIGGGGVCYAASSITVANAGPFRVAYPNDLGIAWGTGTQRSILWDVNNTNLPPVGCDSIQILLSTNNGNTYSVLVNSSPNYGSQLITVPTVTTIITTCRIKIVGRGGVFYDVSDNRFTITTDVTVGMNHVSANNALVLEAWPNPAEEQVTIAANHLDPESVTKLSVSNLIGETVFFTTFTKCSDLKETINLNEFPKGIYFLKIQNGSNESVLKVVKP